MLAPKKLKMRKPHRPDVKGRANRMNFVAFGEFGLVATTGGWVKAREIEAARRVISRFTKRGGKVWIRVFPHRAITNKGSQTTMGGGKGVPEYYVAVVKPGMVLFEISGIGEKQAREAFALAGYKFSVTTGFIQK